MHLWKHPTSGYWYARSVNGRTSLRTKDREEALSRLEDLKRAPQGALLASDVAVYLAEKASKPSHQQMVVAWKHLLPFFGHLRHDQVTRQHCRAYIQARRAKGIKDGTIARELSVVAAAARYSHPNTPGNFELPAASKPRDKRLTRAQFKALIDQCDIPHVKLFAILALSTGARRTAILQLKWDQVDFVRGLIDLRAQAMQGKGRAIVPMTEMVRKALLEAYSIRRCEFVVEYGGQGLKTVKRGFARAATLADLRGVTPHILRHTAATWMAESGVPMSEIAAFLGHRDSRITERVYAKYSPSYLSKAALALEV